MPNMNEMVQSKYLKAPDLEGEEWNVTVSHRHTHKGHPDMEKVELGGEEKWVLYFEGVDKGLVMNKTNLLRAAKAYGDDSKDWNGKPLILYVEPTQNRDGTPTEGLRIKPPARGARTIGSGGGYAAAKGRGAPPDDEIPF